MLIKQASSKGSLMAIGPDIAVIHADLGDGKRRRLFLGADELRQIKRECGRGFYTIYVNFDKDAEPDEVSAILRLALIGGGMTPQDALDLVQYYASPPRPLQHAYLIAFEALSAAWRGSDKSASGGKRMTAQEMDDFFTEAEAALIKNGSDLSVLRGRSFAEIQDVFAALSKDADKPSAPDAETFNAIKAAGKKKGKK
ncbi:gene transfer agent family protein [Paracoccus siganidrum]|nr:gene transfer agent family protein [Paracoccus siganidrum]